MLGGAWATSENVDCSRLNGVGVESGRNHAAELGILVNKTGP